MASGAPANDSLSLKAELEQVSDIGVEMEGKALALADPRSWPRDMITQL